MKCGTQKDIQSDDESSAFELTLPKFDVDFLETKSLEDCLTRIQMALNVGLKKLLYSCVTSKMTMEYYVSLHRRAKGGFFRNSSRV